MSSILALSELFNRQIPLSTVHSFWWLPFTIPTVAVTSHHNMDHSVSAGALMDWYQTGIRFTINGTKSICHTTCQTPNQRVGTLPHNTQRFPVWIKASVWYFANSKMLAIWMIRWWFTHRTMGLRCQPVARIYMIRVCASQCSFHRQKTKSDTTKSPTRWAATWIWCQLCSIGSMSRSRHTRIVHIFSPIRSMCAQLWPAKVCCHCLRRNHRRTRMRLFSWAKTITKSQWIMQCVPYERNATNSFTIWIMVCRFQSTKISMCRQRSRWVSICLRFAWLLCKYASNWNFQYFQDILNRTITNQPLPWYKTLKSYYKRDEWELYDLKYDPTESKNLVQKTLMDDVRSKLAARLSDWMSITQDPWRCEFFEDFLSFGRHFWGFFSL